MFIGTAAWSIPRSHEASFPSEGSHLERYSLIFNATEINSSFYREHMAKTYSRWAEAVPDDFRFSVKLSRALIHDCGLKPAARSLEASLDNIFYLGDKLGVLLVQLPPSLGFHRETAERFFKLLRKKYSGHLALEPRNSEWLKESAQGLLLEYQVSKVLADPEKCPLGDPKILSAGGFRYYRLHGSPVIYQSQYTDAFISKMARELKPQVGTWCVFDNTTFGHATEDALRLMGEISE